MRNKPLNVCIGILARNEEERIGDLIADLGRQTLLTSAPLASVKIVVVANGCTDRTADVARRALARRPFDQLRVSPSVYELARPGKSNAWNELVHRITPNSTDYIIFLDADIRIPERTALNLVLQRLMMSPKAVVAVDRSVKDIELEKPRGIVERLIKVATGTANDPRTAIAGACYCACFSEVRRIWMPIGLPGEDGFVRAMLLTSNFGHEEQLQRLVFVEDAYHVFESIRDFGGIVRHNVRLAIGTAVNILLFWHFMQLRKEKKFDVAEYVCARNASDPGWVNSLMRERLSTSYFPLEPRFLLRRLQTVGSSPARQRSPKAWAVALLGTGFDLIVFLKATMLMRKGAGAGYW